MDLKLLPTVICRTPLFSYEDTLEDKWDDLKEAIKISSKDLYEQIKDTKKEDYDKLPEKVRFSCWKYFNRARFRATPFGPFGSITMVPLSSEGTEVTVEKDPTLHTFTNWIHKDTLLTDLPTLYKNAKFFQANTSVYPCGDQLRYISTLEDGTFEIASIDQQEIVEEVLNLCKTSIAKEKIVEHLIQTHQLELSVIEDLLIQLIELQLLLTDLHPNIIGTDYFKRVGLDTPALKEDPYIIAARPLLKGSLSAQQFKVIPEAINFIKDYLPQPVHKPLEDFKRAFQLKFEYREVPLLEALDPEIGIGYNALESSPHTDELVELLKNNRPSQDNEQIPYTPFHQFLLNGILKGEDIQLEELAKHKLPKYDTRLPNTFSAIIKQVDDQLILEQVGGCTANSPLGRFTLENPDLTEHCKHVISLEERANPDIIFFDIGYQSEASVDNINRREAIYNYQLPILSWCHKNLIRLDDIMVSIMDGDVVLRSKEHSKRLIPRLTSSYNYTRSDLSLYRFLCDLQYQGLQSVFNINLQSLFPGLDFYPKVTYKNVLLAPRIWKIPNIFIQKRVDIISIKALKNWLEDEAVSNYFAFGERDRFLIFRRDSLDDLSNLFHELQQKKNLYIYEVFFPSNSFIKNAYQQSYLSEILINLHHNKIIYQAVKDNPFELNRKAESLILPGGNWVYFEVYGHPAYTNSLLINRLQNYLKGIRQKIQQWFFIRYSIPSPHIRLRIHLKNYHLFHTVVNDVTSLLAPDLRAGLLKDLQLKPYHKEIERYGVNTIEQVEMYFGKDSEYVLDLISAGTDLKTFYLLIIRLLDDIFLQLNIEDDLRLRRFEAIASDLAQKYDLTGYKFKKINGLWKELMAKPQLHLPKRLESKYKSILEEANRLLSTVNHERRLQMVGDLLHMHINRLFSTDQNIHEFIVYQLYCNVMKSRLKNPGRRD